MTAYRDYIPDNALDAYYGANWYEPGVGYFDDPPEDDEDYDEGAEANMESVMRGYDERW